MKLQYHLNLTIRLFSVIIRTLVGGGLTPRQRLGKVKLVDGDKKNQKLMKLYQKLCTFAISLLAIIRGKKFNNIY